MVSCIDKAIIYRYLNFEIYTIAQMVSKLDWCVDKKKNIDT